MIYPSVMKFQQEALIPIFKIQLILEILFGLAVDTWMRRCAIFVYLGVHNFLSIDDSQYLLKFHDTKMYHIYIFVGKVYILILIVGSYDDAAGGFPLFPIYL